MQNSHRQLSKAHKFVYDNLIRERKSPCFELYSSQMQIISNPTDYYLALHKLANDAERRISMSALYIGTGKLEKYLVNKLDKKMMSDPKLKLTVLLDYMRGTRVNRSGESSQSILKPLKQNNF